MVPRDLLMERHSSDGSSVWKVATVALGMIAVSVCAYSFMLYGAFSAELNAARIEINLAHDEVTNLRAQLSSTEALTDALLDNEEIRHAQVAAGTRRDLPIQLSFRNAVSRSGKVAVLHNLGDADLEVVLDVHSPASGGHVRRPLVIDAHGLLEIGAAQGWRFAPGQIVTLESDRYRPIVRIVS
jgi:hypothetical protein